MYLNASLKAESETSFAALRDTGDCVVEVLFIFGVRVVLRLLTNDLDFALSNKTRAWQKAARPDSFTNYSDVVEQDTVYKAFGESGHAQPLNQNSNCKEEIIK